MASQYRRESGCSSKALKIDILCGLIKLNAMAGLSDESQLGGGLSGNMAKALAEIPVSLAA